MSIKKALSMAENLPVSIDDEEGADFWQNHLDQWVRSGLSQAAYCRKYDLIYDWFRKWKERLSAYPSSSTSIKLVEVKRDFTLKSESEHSSSSFASGVRGGGVAPNNRVPTGIRTGGSSGIRFWCGEFCIEVDVKFSSDTLKQLVRTLQGVYIQPGVEVDAEGNSKPVATDE